MVFPLATSISFRLWTNFSTSLYVISSGHPAAHCLIITIDQSRHLVDAIACQDKWQFMDRQTTQRYVVQKNHEKQIDLLYLAFGLGIKMPVEKGVVGVYGSQWPGTWDHESSSKDFGSSTIAFIPYLVWCHRGHHLSANAPVQLFFLAWRLPLQPELQGIWIILHQVDPFIPA